MRPIHGILVVALLNCCGCKSADEHGTPVGMTRTTMPEQIAGRRIEDSKVPFGDVVDGQHAK
jgi:hypothetical protein